MRKAWAVASGEYSGYGVTCICLEEGLAQELANHFNLKARPHGDYRVEEFPMPESAEDLQQLSRYHIEVDNEGQEVSREISLIDLWSDEDPSQYDDRGGVYSARGYDPKHPTYRASGWSIKGFDEALKAARDRLAHHRARLAGID